MNLQGALHADLVEDINDRIPAGGELLVAIFDHLRRHGWEHCQDVPDGRSSEAVNHLDAKGGGGASGVLDILGGALAHALGVAVTPDPWWHDTLVAFVDHPVG